MQAATVIGMDTTALDTLVRGEVIRPGDERYDEARAVHNASIDKHPALVVRCADVADVIAVVNFARDNALRLAVRGGGHNPAGEALHPFSAGGSYVNFLVDEGQERVEASYRDNYPRLREIKKRYDPANLFRLNQNIRPVD